MLIFFLKSKERKENEKVLSFQCKLEIHALFMEN